MDAAWSVLVETGYDGSTYEAVAARAETSRPVIYPRCSDRASLLLAAVPDHLRKQPIHLPDTGNLRDDALEFSRNTNQTREDSTALIGAQLMTYFRQTGSSFSDLRQSLKRNGKAAFETFVERGVKRGELRDFPTCARVIDLPYDLLRHDIYMTLRPVSEASIEEIVDKVWMPLLLASDGVKAQ
ncbi:TetR/AcrR family transcriptional regulator [Robbsia sp. KACC 23696]|uniref:TetR/AcrR family transcriptional regulator n=1 Tax=Robbsia sp. KACC 23696 TaxID=3149231 RepID=UPI00325AEF81